MANIETNTLQRPVVVVDEDGQVYRGVLLDAGKVNALARWLCSAAFHEHSEEDGFCGDCLNQAGWYLREEKATVDASSPDKIVITIPIR